MDVQDQNDQSSDVPKKQLDDYALKIRKPYTITKQRERWSGEEHKKFVEALKLYGRAWRRIEEHVGTKTTVQIRSHAQKFFSKVVRESNSEDASTIKPIEIPPPRPKRKPMHPYPRKMASPVKSRKLSILEQENQSPTSVLSSVGSDTLARLGSNSPNGTPSPISELPHSSLEENGSVSNQANACSNTEEEEEAVVKLELFPQDIAFVKEGSADTSSAQFLKLFGKTVLVTNCHRPTTPTLGTSNRLSVDVTERSPVQAFPVSAPPLPWWASCESAPNSSMRVYSPVPVKPCPLSDNKVGQDRDTQKDGSSNGSNTDSDEDKKSDVEAQSLGEEARFPLRSTKVVFLEHRVTSVNCNKGFVPYKRCLADRDMQSSIIARDERSEQRIRLCL